MNTLEPAPAAAVLPQRALRVAALSLLSVVVTPILVIFAIGIDFRVIEKVLELFNDRDPSERVALYSLVPLLLLVAAGIFFGLWKLLARSWTRIAAGFAAFALLFVYLAHDESTYRHPMTVEDISPVFPGEDASYNLLMRYGKQHPLGQGFQAPTFKNPYPKLVLSPASEWRGTITSRREELEAHWTQLATERSWWNELSQFDKKMCIRDRFATVCAHALDSFSRARSVCIGEGISAFPGDQPDSGVPFRAPWDDIGSHQ